MGRKLNKGRFFSNKVVKNTESAFDNTESLSMILLSEGEKSGTFSSSLGGSSKSGFRIGNILDGLGVVNLSLCKGC